MSTLRAQSKWLLSSIIPHFTGGCQTRTWYGLYVHETGIKVAFPFIEILYFGKRSGGGATWAGVRDLGRRVRVRQVRSPTRSPSAAILPVPRPRPPQSLEGAKNRCYPFCPYILQRASEHVYLRYKSIGIPSSFQIFRFNQNWVSGSKSLSCAQTKTS